MISPMKRSGIYEIRNTANGKRYIGSATDLRVRMNVHRSTLNSGEHHSRYLQAAWGKHGAGGFVFRTLLICAPRDLLMFEQRAIDVMRPEYNICRIAGNALGVKWTEEARAKCSERQRAAPNFAGRKHTAETLALMVAAKTGRPSPTKGMKRSPEAVAKTAAAHRGMKRSDETRRKIAAKAIGRKRSAESIERGAAKLRGVPLPEERRRHLLGNKHALGLKHTDEWKAAASARQIGVKRPKDAAYRAKIAAALKGIKHSDERRANQSAAQRGKKRGPCKTQPPLMASGT